MNNISGIKPVAGIKYLAESRITENLPTLKSKFVSVERSSDKRKPLIIFTIIFILVLIIIITIITVIALSKSNNISNETNTSTNNVFNTPTVTTAATALIYDIGNGGISGDPPCLSYTVINDPSRNVNKGGGGGTCDTGPLFNTTIDGRWIRFEGIGGTIIPSTSPGLQHCSAYLTGWSNVTLPSTINTLVNGTVCFDTLGGPCFFHTAMSVISCGQFYVYFLRPTNLCNARYCTI